MKIFLASGFTVSNVIGREKELFEDTPGDYNRLVSFPFIVEDKYECQILDLMKEIENDNISCYMGGRQPGKNSDQDRG